jgi:hypothetical protein
VYTPEDMPEELRQVTATIVSDEVVTCTHGTFTRRLVKTQHALGTVCPGPSGADVRLIEAELIDGVVHRTWRMWVEENR